MSTHEYPKEMIDPGDDAPVAPADGWEHLKVYGYAPGDYMTRCHVCGAITNGVDKRAVTCRPCAEATHAKSKATPVAPAGDKPAMSDESRTELPEWPEPYEVLEAWGQNVNVYTTLQVEHFARTNAANRIAARDAQWAQREQCLRARILELEADHEHSAGVIAQMRADMSDWQPISTAPTDGRTILLGHHNKLGKWRTMRGQWMSQECIDETWEDPEAGEPGWFETSVENDELPNCWATNPTHWQPLPAPPEKTA